VVRFNDLRVPASDILGEPGKGFRYAQVRLAPARLTHCMRWLGAARRAHDIAAEYAGRREVFGARLVNHEGVGFMLADNEIDIRMSRLAIWHTAWLLDQGARGTTESSIAKVFCSEAIWRVVDRCVQVLGGQGVTGETLVERIFREVRAFRIYDGPSEVHRWSLAQRIARQGPNWERYPLPTAAEVRISHRRPRRGDRRAGCTSGLARTAGPPKVAHGATLPGHDAAEEAASAIGERAGIQVADVAREADVLALRDSVLARFGRIDVLVNNAGINPIFRGIERTSLEEWQSIIDINLTGTFLCCKHLGEAMVGQGKGSIINISSVAGHVGLLRSVPYCASKGGVEMLTRALALDWAKRGVRVNTLAPGWVDTDLTHGLLEHDVHGRRLLDHTPMGRFATAGDMVGAAVFLASDASAYMTGQSLLIDGGWTAD
jgi:NAD(P)-dependent dehydrogenase (short-subunit alcohol dehydrogenase family)